jgi:hypothetical protein
MIRFLTAPSANDLFSHPLQWAGKHLALYAAAAVIAGAVFVAGSAIYSRLAPAPAATEIPAPLKFLPATEPASPKPAPLGEEKDALVAAGDWEFPIGTTIGARVFDAKRNEVGKIKDVTLTPIGETKVMVMKMNGKLVTLPAEAFDWKATSPTYAASAVGLRYSVEAIAKKPLKQLE